MSPNFAFLAKHHPLLVRYAAKAERAVFDDPNDALIRLRQFGEFLAQLTCGHLGVELPPEPEFASVLRTLADRRVANRETLDLFHGLRRAGNDAVHKHADDRSEALHQLRMARQLAVWFHRSFGKDPNFKPGPFTPPPNPEQAGKELADELERLRDELAEQRQQAAHASLTAAEAAAARAQAEADAQRAYDDLAAAMSLAEETEARLAAEQLEFRKQLAELQQSVATEKPEVIEAVVEATQKAASLLDLDEAATRHIIDAQLRTAGWEADTQQIRFKKGVRPQKGRNLAIAEWPTDHGPADYVLFVGLTPVAVVEAKKAIADVSGSIQQAKRYSNDFTPEGDLQLPGGPWGKYRIPFLFATNGRPFLEQLRTKSGIWFLDAREKTNHSRPLNGWYTPDGLLELLKQDAAAADQKLAEESPDFLPLRDYQLKAVRKVEEEIAAGQRKLLVAMATGTGKTRTCIGLVYRLVRAKRFRRILFLVDRSALGQQTADAFKDVKLENQQSFTEIYDVKELGDIQPDNDTRVQIATIQGMVKRLLFSDDDGAAFPVDSYDAIVVDECHRGYSLDQELSDTELTFRDEADYISKYRRILDHFDAVKIGLTATPALHTTEIFGKPVYQYTYRQAVIDGFLIDHEPPVRIVTKLAKDGIKWEKGEVIQTYYPDTGEIVPVSAPDVVKVDVDEFNKRVITESFNQVVCRELAEHIDPSLPGKSLIFCATDAHADMVVDILKKAFEDKYGSVDDDAVLKITGKTDKPLQVIRRFKNERLPSVAVTVDLLTTGIDVPAIVNLVFLRRVRSRILYEQMLGRATRLCEDLYGPRDHKEVFRIFDAVDLYKTMQKHSDMKPVVVQPQISFAQLALELQSAPNVEARKLVQGQFVAKLRRKAAIIAKHHAEKFQALTGTDPDSLADQLAKLSPAEARDWLASRPNLPRFLDEANSLDPRRLLISDHQDEVQAVEHGYGDAKKPADYLEAFREYVTSHANELPALLIVTKRPRDLTRQQLRELKLALDEAGFTEANLQTAWRDTTNQDIAATIIGYIRHVANGSPLLAYRERVAKAMAQILGSRPWTAAQRRWLERIGKQLELETIVDQEAFAHGQFLAEGGFQRLNKIFDGKLDDILKDIAEALWQVAA